MAQSALQCKKCGSVWTRQTVLQDACPECAGEIVDITNTRLGKEFLSIIGAPAELRSTSRQDIYATGPSFLLSVNHGDRS